MEVVPGNAVVFAQVTLGLVPEVLDAVDVVAAALGELLLVVDPAMVEARDVEVVVSMMTIGINHGIQRYLGIYDGDHRGPCSVRQHRRVDAAAALEDTKHRHLAGSSAASLAFAVK